MVRDVARILSKTFSVMIVESSDEIGGPAETPQSSVGKARPISVLGGKRYLLFVLIESVENNTQYVVLAENVGNRKEAPGIITARQSGVRVISSVHGSVRSVVRCPPLCPVLGGRNHVVCSDASYSGEISRKAHSVQVAKRC